MAWLVFDIGCLECQELSAVVGVYATREEAELARGGHPDPQVRGTHSVQVFELPEVTP